MRILALVCLMSLTGCMVATSKTAGNMYGAGKEGFKEETKTMRYKIAQWFYPDADVVYIEKPQPFCYKSIADLNCYKDPVPGEEDRLIEP